MAFFMVQSWDFKNVCEVIGNKNIESPQQSWSKHFPDSRSCIARSVLLSLLQLIVLFISVLLDSTNNFKKISPSLSSSDSRAIRTIKPIVYGSRDLTFMGIYYSNYMVSCCIKATPSPYILSLIIVESLIRSVQNVIKNNQ